MALRSKILSLPKEVVEEINQRILVGEPLESIYKFLLTRPGVGEVPSIEALKRYAKLYLKYIKRSDERTETALDQSFDESSEIFDLGEISLEELRRLEGKREILFKLLKLCNSRIRAIKEIQEISYTPQWESLLSTYVREARATIDTLVRLLSEEEKKDFEKSVFEQVSKVLGTLVTVFVQCVREVYGFDNFEKFKELVKSRLRDYNIKVEL